MDTRSGIIRVGALVISDQDIKYFEAVQYIRHAPKDRCVKSAPV